MASREKTSLLEDGSPTVSYSSGGKTPGQSRRATLSSQGGEGGGLSNIMRLLAESKPPPKDDSDESSVDGKDGSTTRVPTLPFGRGTATYVKMLKNENVTAKCHSGTSFFPTDHTRRVDFVLVWNKDDNSGDTQVKQRRIFEAWLRRKKLQMVDYVSATDVNTHYVLLHAPDNLIMQKAEEMHVKVTVKESKRDDDHFSKKIFGLCGWNPLECGLEEKTMYLASPFTMQLKEQGRYDKVDNGKNMQKFFSISQRVRIVHQILTETKFGVEPSDVGIDQLVESNSYQSAYPLHEGPHTPPEDWDGTPEGLSARQQLHQYWSRWSCWYKYQPLDHIKNYFGVHIALYFAWLGFYTAWLMPAAVLGFIIFVIGACTMIGDQEIQEVCHGDKLMCPLCTNNASSKCQPYNISTSCTLYRIGFMFDNGGTVFFAVFMALWATLFLEFWKRQTAMLSYRWNTMDFESSEEPIRAKYALKATERRKNPITDQVEPHMPESKRYPRYLTGFSILFAMVGMIAISIIAVMVYRTFSTKLLGAGIGTTVASLSASVLQVVIIIILSKVYGYLAVKLTEWENHRTETAYQDNLTLKRFLFEFANYYSSIFYIAFFKGRWVGMPGHWNINVFGFHPEQCGPAGCMQELAQQLAIIMIGKQMINNVLEFILPFANNWWRERKARKQAEKLTEEDDTELLGLSPKTDHQWEQDFKLDADEGLFGEYLEMVLQFGFITIFVAAFPLAPLFALLNNWIEIRLDAHNYVCAMKRPIPELAQDIGVWYTILDMLVKIAIICSAFIIAFTSSFIDRVFYRFNYNYNLKGISSFRNSLISGSENGSDLGYDCWFKGHHDEYGQRTLDYWHLVALRVAFVIVFEHVAFIIANALDLLVPDIPQSLDEKIKREAYQAQRELEIMMAVDAEDEDQGHLFP